MVLYAASPVRRARQVAGDVFLALWVVLWLRLGTALHDATRALAVPGRELAEAGDGLAERLRDAGDTLSGAPFIGDEISAPFDSAGSAADQVAAAGNAQVAAVEQLANWLGVLVAAVPILLALLIWVPRRIAFARRASAGRRLVDASEDLDLFALRAMTHQPLHRLAKISHDPAGEWRRKDPRVIRELARLELRDVGLPEPPVGAAEG